MSFVEDPLDAKSVLLSGNGKYAHQVHKELVVDRSWKAINLLEETSVQSSSTAFLMTGAIYQPRRAIALMKDMGIRRAVLAGDVGGIRWDSQTLRTALARDLRGNLTFMARMIFRNLASRFQEVQIVLLLQLISDMLTEGGIQPVIASSVVPNLKPPLGPMNRIAEERFDWGKVRDIVQAALPDIERQHRQYVRQAAVIDDLRVVARELENTRELLSAAAQIPRGEGPRSLVKLAPMSVAATIDAPVIGEDTISQAIAAQIDLIVLDSRNGILAQSENAIDLATKNGIALFGYEADAS